MKGESTQKDGRVLAEENKTLWYNVKIQPMKFYHSFVFCNKK